MKILLSGLLFAIAFCSPALADMKASDLYSLCTAGPREQTQDLLCSYFIAGFNEGFFGGQFMAEKGVKSCMPAIGTVQARAVIEKYMKDHPERLHEPVGPIVFAALVTAFPCNRR